MWTVITLEDVLLAYGPLGIGVLVMGWAIRFFFLRLVRERDELHAQREQMITMLFELVPLIKRATQIIETVETRRVGDEERQYAVMAEVREALRDVHRSLERR